MTALRSQRGHVEGNKHYEKAYKAGVDFWQRVYGGPLAWKVLAHAREREWKQAMRDLLVLVRYHPLAFLRAFRKVRAPVHFRRWIRALW